MRHHLSWIALALALAIAAPPGLAAAVCRVVEPPVDSGRPGVAFDPLTTAIYVEAPDQTLSVSCPAGEPIEPDRSGGHWSCPDGARADEVRGTLLSMVLQPSIVARGGSAGLVMPVPARPDVHAGSQGLVDAARGLVDPWVEETVYVQEDPSLGYQCSDPHFSALESLAAAPMMLYGCSSEYYRPGTAERETTSTVYEDAGVVRSERIETTDAYDITVVSADSLAALLAWMDDNGFAHRAVDEEALAHYVGDGHWFVALHVHPDESGRAQALAPLVVTWPGDVIPVTHRLQYDPSGGVLQTDAYVIAPHRMTTSDESGFTEHAQPVELRGTALEGFGLAEGWLTRLSMTRIASQWVQVDGVLEATEDEEVIQTTTRTTRARIAAPCCYGGQAAPRDREAFRTHEHERRFRLSEETPIPSDWLGSTPSPGPEWCGGETFGFGESETRSDLRGCAISGRTLGGLVGGWGPIALVVGLLLWRHRRLPRRRR